MGKTTYTMINEKELVLKQRAAFIEGANHAYETMLNHKGIYIPPNFASKAEEVYPIPKKIIPNIITDQYTGHEYRLIPYTVNDFAPVPSYVVERKNPKTFNWETCSPVPLQVLRTLVVIPTIVIDE